MSLYRRSWRTPLMVVSMAMESGGRSWGMKGLLSSHLRLAAASWGTIIGLGLNLPMAQGIVPGMKDCQCLCHSH
jgi:hypothetical protein